MDMTRYEISASEGDGEENGSDSGKDEYVDEDVDEDWVSVANISCMFFFLISNPISSPQLSSHSSGFIMSHACHNTNTNAKVIVPRQPYFVKLDAGEYFPTPVDINVNPREKLAESGLQVHIHSTLTHTPLTKSHRSSSNLPTSTLPPKSLRTAAGPGTSKAN